MKGILVRVDGSIEQIELDGKESIKEIVGEKFDEFDIFGKEDSGVYLCGSTDKRAQSKPNQLATLIWTDFLNGDKERAYEEREVKKYVEHIENSLNDDVPEEASEELKERLRAKFRRGRNELKKSGVASLRYRIRTAVGDELYGNVVICMENEDLPEDIIQKIMDTAEKYS